MRIKRPIIVCGWGCAPDPTGGAYFVFLWKDIGGHRRVRGSAGGGGTGQKG